MTPFAGIVTGGEPVDRRLLEILGSQPYAPGPRDVRVWSGGRLGLSSEEPPVHDEASGCVAVFDGRLDNREELARLLGAHERVLASGTDGAYALAAFLEWNEAAPARLLGDFALAACDPAAGTMLVARDPMGVRPLYTARRAGGLVFASTLEQLLRHPQIAAQPDEETLLSHLYYPLLPHRRSYFRDVEPLFGGERLTAREGAVRTNRFRTWPDEPPEFRQARGDEAEELAALLEEAVRCRLRTSGPLGILLSGGLDSGSLASLAGSLLGRGVRADVRAFTWTFDRFPPCDEREYSREVTRRYGLPHVLLPSDERWTLSAFEEWLPSFHEPFFGPFSDLFYAALAAGRDAGVAAMQWGFMGDNVLLGSWNYLASWLAHGRWRALHGELRALARERTRGYGAQLLARAALPLLPVTVQRAVELRRTGLASTLGWMPPALRRRAVSDPRPRIERGRDAWWRSLRADLATTGDSPQLAYFDRLLRRYGLEPSFPFLDVRLVEFVLRTPPDAFFRDGRPRVLHRQALWDVLPPRVRDRTTKGDLSPLVRHGLREGRRAFVEQLLVDSELEARGYVLRDTWTQHVRGFLAGRHDYPSWLALTLELWLRHREGRLPGLE